MDYGKITNNVLHWNYRGFTEFPLQRLHGEEDEITDIYLKENLISRIPSDIGKLNNLESLYLSGNDITELPREISKLTRLKCLDLSGNRLQYIPDEIGEVRNLKFLILDENEVRELPLRIAELRMLRYLSVCDNNLQWLPQRPVYNYHHCEFRFWRNPNLKTIPYSLWYHMFRGQQTRSLNIGCLSYPRCQETCNSTRRILRLNQNSTECTLNYDFPAIYNHIIVTSVVPSLFELCKRKFYEIISDAAKKLTPTPRSIYCDFYDTGYNENNNNVKSLQESLNHCNINSNEHNDENNNKKDLPKSNKESSKEFDDILLTTKRKGSCVPKDMIEEYFYYLPRFIKNDLCNGPLSRCENVRCKKPIFDFVYYEFCIEKLILIAASEDIILNAAFCSKSCAEAWKPGKNIVHWKFV
ncbi:leucine-rich repeat-containing protein 57-like isoform X1 [Melitaea cinxia]|uniref:leucine-rich repeat-containing protein 57-like isoform X1 n=1 Tax=Melitaea cinxia TaxID=113334 RepID=UPI001E2718DC|nr:leucine-rich repeat-containing protein 57-like isoform X1 [Melitaea cinxia]